MPPTKSASHGSPKALAAAKPAQAPTSICPSTPRLITAVRCTSVSPSRAKSSGVVARRLAAIHAPMSSEPSI